MSALQPAQSSKRRRQILDYTVLTYTVIGSLFLILSSIGAAITFSIVASHRPLTDLEAVLLQFIALALGLVGSFIFGRQSASASARQMIKPHARSAFRRVLYLYESLGRLARVIERVRSGEAPVKPANTSSPFDILEVIVTEQIVTASDALEDWRDLIPEDVEEVERQIASRGVSVIERLSK